MSAPIISVVTPSFNQGRFIDETIRSVISQEGDFHLEYLILDGGSTDDTLEVIKKYDRLIKEGNWPVRCRGIEYRWVSEKDKGQADAVNKGFKIARGEIVAWLNSDDTYLPGALEKARSYFVQHPAVMMTYGEGYLIDEKGKVVERFSATQPFNLWGLIYVADYILQPTVFIRKEALKETGLLDLGLNWCLDWDLWIRIGKKFRVEYIPDFFANARMYQGTKSSLGGLKRFDELVRIMRKHGKRKFPPGYFIYGHGALLQAVGMKPRFYNPVLKKTIHYFAMVLYVCSLNRKIKECQSCSHANINI
jgi:glycosyltransferase involved in cell wall biosynthesis